MRQICTALSVILCWSICQSFAQNHAVPDQNDASAEDLRQIGEYIKLFQENRASVSKYAVAISVEVSRECFDDSTEPFVTQNWFTHCKDGKLHCERHDEILTFQAKTGDGKYYTARKVPLAVIQKEEEFTQIYQDLVVPTRYKDENKKEIKLKEQTNFDPWELVIDGTDCLQLLDSTAKPPWRARYFRPEMLESVEEKALGITNASFKCTEDTSYLVMFDQRFGNMPVSVQLVSREENYAGVMWTTTVTWKKHGNSWLPLEVLNVRKSGNPSKPRFRTTSDFALSWMVGGGIPPSIFSTTADTIIRPMDLRDKILRFAAISRD